MSRTDAPSTAQEIEDILAEGLLCPVFQPVTDLVTGATVGCEALCRGPDDSSLHEPTPLFEAARSAGRLHELDWACRVAALKQVLDLKLYPPFTLFLNIEPGLTGEAPEMAGPVLARAMAGLRVIVELTERELLAHPARLLRLVEVLRYTGWGIALDDVGAQPESLAVLSVVEPDVVKLDAILLQSMSSSQAAATVSGVQTYCRRSGARIVVEGLETSDDVDTARAIQAHYGQGFALGRPARLSTPTTLASTPVPLINPRHHRPTRRLITLLTRRDPPQHLTREAVDRLTGYVLEHAEAMGGDVLVVACLQDVRHMSAELRTRLAQVAAKVAHVTVLGAAMPPAPAAGVRGVRLRTNDPLVCEWVIAVIGLQESIALIAEDLGDDYDDNPRRRYDSAVTYEPSLVTDVVRALLMHVP